MRHAMSIDTPRHSPGVKSPPGAMIALGVVAVMGVYGFTTTLQKSLTTRRDAIAAVRADARDVRLASAIAPTPALVYALSDAPPPSPVVKRAPRLPEPMISPEPVPVELTAVSPTPAPQAAASASEVAVNASAIETTPAEGALQP